MKKIYVVTDNNRLQKKWNKLLSSKYEMLFSVNMVDFNHQLEPDDYLILAQDETLSKLHEAIDALDTLPSKNILVLRTIPSLQEGEALIAYGVGGYGNINMADPIFTQAIEVISSGNMWLYPDLMGHVIKRVTRFHRDSTSGVLNHLTKREQEVAKLVAQGESNKRIADDLKISMNTVKLHLASIYHKLHIKNRVALAVMVNSENQ